MGRAEQIAEILDGLKEIGRFEECQGNVLETPDSRLIPFPSDPEARVRYAVTIVASMSGGNCWVSTPEWGLVWAC